MMRALTLHQPWAWAVVHADKGVENRPVAPPEALIGDDFAVHAGLVVDEAAHADFRAGRYGDAARAVPDLDKLVRGAVIGVARLDDYVRGPFFPDKPRPGRDFSSDARWFAGPVGNLLSNRRAIASPIPCRGMQGWWPVPAPVEAAVREQLAREEHRHG